MKKKALIIGHTGQDGHYLIELLNNKGYEICGISRSEIYSNTDLKLNSGDILDNRYTDELISVFRPDELYYLAALHQSSVEQSIDDLSFYRATINVNAMGLLNFLSSIDKFHKKCKVFYASSSHIFGATRSETQDEFTAFCPVSIYGVSKVLGMQYCELYRQKGVFCACGIFYNHESPKRESKFVSKKIVEAAVAIYNGSNTKLELGDLDARTDWGYAPDYVNAAFLMLQEETDGNYIVSSGELHTVRDFVRVAFSELGLSWEDHVAVNQNIILKKSVTVLYGNNQKLKDNCKWIPTLNFKEMVSELVKAELGRVRNLPE